MKDKTDKELFTLATAKLEKAKDLLGDILTINEEASARAKTAGEWDNFQAIQSINAAVHHAMSGAHSACALSFNLESGEITPRTGGGGK